MKTYIDNLRAASDDANRRRQEAKTNSYYADPRVLCDKPLMEQISLLMSALSPAQRDRPWSMDELVVRLQGRYSARPHPMNVGQALRQLGWVPSRDWSVQGGSGRRVWILPDTD